MAERPSSRTAESSNPQGEVLSEQPSEYNVQRILDANTPDTLSEGYKWQLESELSRLDPSEHYKPHANYHREILQLIDGKSTAEQVELIKQRFPNPADFLQFADESLEGKYGEGSQSVVAPDREGVEWILRMNAPRDLANVIYGDRYKEYADQRDAIKYNTGPYQNGIPTTAEELPATPDADLDQAPQTPPEVVDTEPVVAEPEAAASELAALPDAEIRYTDAEILGKRYPVRQAVSELGNQRMRAVEATKAKWYNALDTPAKIRRGFAANLAERRYNRQKARLDEVAHLPDGNRLKERRLAKATRAKDKMDRMQNIYRLHTSAMEQRTRSVGENAEARRAEYTRELKGRREAALARRTLRRELRAQGAGRAETRAILKEIPAEHAQRVGRIAAQAEVSRRSFGQAERQVAKATKHEETLQRNAEQTERKIAQYTEEAENAEAILRKLSGEADPANPSEGSLPSKEAHVAQLQAHLDSVPADDPDRIALQVQLEEAKHAVAIVVEREIPYWQSVASKRREEIGLLERQREHYQQQRQEAQAATAAQNAELEARRALYEQDASARSTTAEHVINQ